MLWVETLNVNSATPTITITTYNLAKNSTSGMMHIQNQLVDELYMTKSSVFVSCTNQIIRYTHEGNKEVYRYTVYGYETVDFSSSGDSPTFLLTPRGGDFHSVKILTLAEDADAGAVETYLQLPTEGVAAFIMGSKLVVASREKLFTYSLKGKLSRGDLRVADRRRGQAERFRAAAQLERHILFSEDLVKPREARA